MHTYCFRAVMMVNPKIILLAHNMAANFYVNKQYTRHFFSTKSDNVPVLYYNTLHYWDSFVQCVRKEKKVITIVA